MTTRLVLPGLLGLGLALSGCRTTRAASEPTRDTDVPEAILIAVDDARSTSQSSGIEIPASIESTRRAVLSSRLAAAIVGFDAREGDSVRTGAILVRLEDAAMKAGVSAAEASDVAAARDLARARALFAKGAATRYEFESAETAAARASSSLVAAREALSFTSIRAPFSGFILKKLARAGDIANPGQPLVEIEGEGGLEIVASLERAVRDGLSIGDKIQARIDGVTKPVAAVIHDLSLSGDPSTQRFTLRADIGAEPGLRAGLFARILIASSGGEPRILVPTNALERRGGLTGVYVIRDGRAWLRWIAPGDAFGATTEVRAGLEAGERVALDPSRLHDGASVIETER